MRSEGGRRSEVRDEDAERGPVGSAGATEKVRIGGTRMERGVDGDPIEAKRNATRCSAAMTRVAFVG